MPLKSFSVPQLFEMDDDFAKETATALQRLVKDIQDRPHDDAARKLVLTVSLVPDLDGDRLATVRFACNVATKVPPAESLSGSLRVKGNGLLEYREGSNSNPDQLTIADAQ